jgi:hypothetical protein
MIRVVMCHSIANLPRPKRTDVGGSRLLHKAILGLAKRSMTAPSTRERGVAKRGEGEMILVPVSMLKEGGPPKKLMVTKKRMLASGKRCKNWKYEVFTYFSSPHEYYTLPALSDGVLDPELKQCFR